MGFFGSGRTYIVEGLRGLEDQVPRQGRLRTIGIAWRCRHIRYQIYGVLLEFLLPQGRVIPLAGLHPLLQIERKALVNSALHFREGYARIASLDLSTFFSATIFSLRSLLLRNCYANNNLLMSVKHFSIYDTVISQIDRQKLKRREKRNVSHR